MRVLIRPSLVGAFLVLALSGLRPEAARADSTPVTHCGQELNTPGDYHLAQDLGPCSGHGVVITASNVRFTLAGHTLSGQASCDTENPQIGVDVRAPATQVTIGSGTVSGFNDGISLFAASRVTAMTLSGNCGSGVLVSGDDSQVDTSRISGSVDGVVLCAAKDSLVTANEIFGNARFGVLLSCGELEGADRSHVVRNILHDNGLLEGAGVAVYHGDDARIVGNSISGNFTGIFLSTTSETVVEDNTLNGNVSLGVSVSWLSHGNVLRDNTAFRNGWVDLADDNADCDSNTWTGNRFETDTVAGVPDGGPSAGCIH